VERHVDLDVIGVIEGTDRASGTRPALDQLRHYEALLAPLRRAPINLIDLSPGDGAALRVWSWFLGAANVIGIGANPIAADPDNARVKTRAGNRADKGFLSRLCSEFPPTVVVDGGPHRADEAQSVFELMFPRLAPGGFYLLPGMGVPTGAAGGGADGIRYFLDLARACIAARPAIKAQPDDPTRLADAVIFVGGGLVVRRRLEGRELGRALSTADGYLAAQRRDSGALERLASYIVHHGGSLARAEAAVDAALEGEGPTLARLLLRAEILVAQKRGEEAELAVAQVAAWPEKSPADRHVLARLQASVGRHAEALAEAQAAAHAEPANAIFAKTLEKLQARAGRG
jgi:hypothetical protein